MERGGATTPTLRGWLEVLAPSTPGTLYWVILLWCQQLLPCLLCFAFSHSNLFWKSKSKLCIWIHMLQNRQQNFQFCWLSRHRESAITMRKELSELLGTPWDMNLVGMERRGQVNLTPQAEPLRHLGHMRHDFSALFLPPRNSKSAPVCHIPLILLCTKAESVWSVFQMKNKGKIIPLKYQTKVIFISHKWCCPTTPHSLKSMGLSTSGKGWIFN